MGGVPAEPPLDPISPDGQVARVHPRPHLAQGGDPERLLAAFIRTVNKHRGASEPLEAYWESAVQAAGHPAAEMAAFLRLKQAEGCPAVHHLPAFTDRCRPAYRVTWLGYLEQNPLRPGLTGAG